MYAIVKLGKKLFMDGKKVEGREYNWSRLQVLRCLDEADTPWVGLKVLRVGRKVPEIIMMKPDLALKVGEDLCKMALRAKGATIEEF